MTNIWWQNLNKWHVLTTYILRNVIHLSTDCIPLYSATKAYLEPRFLLWGSILARLRLDSHQPYIRNIHSSLSFKILSSFGIRAATQSQSLIRAPGIWHLLSKISCIYEAIEMCRALPWDLDSAGNVLISSPAVRRKQEYSVINVIITASIICHCSPGVRHSVCTKL